MLPGGWGLAAAEMQRGPPGDVTWPCLYIRVPKETRQNMPSPKASLVSQAMGGSELREVKGIRGARIFREKLKV